MFNRLELAESDLREHSQTLPYLSLKDSIVSLIYLTSTSNDLLESGIAMIKDPIFRLFRINSLRCKSFIGLIVH